MNRAEAPSRYCDLVMKGGVTSGIVYPLAITELSKVFRLKNIGGTSAAAIAAAAAAAAEYRRCATGGDRSGFDTLESLPAFLGDSPAGMTGTRLLHFFQPRPGARRLFNTVVAAFGASDGALRKGLLAAARNFWPFLVAGSVPGVAALTLALMSPRSGLSVLAGLLGVVVAVVGAVLAVAMAALRTLFVEVPSNFFGLTTGMRGAPSAAQPLTEWLTDYLNELAGFPVGGRPLTFGDLWRADGGDGTDRAVNLEMITTCLTHGRPYRLPFRDDDQVRENKPFYFSERDFRQLFPASVVDWMVAHARPVEANGSGEQSRSAPIPPGFFPLPPPDDLPVVVAVRLSISFPVLLSAVPLYAIDFSRKEVLDRRLERCWFSDGGISSNFPIHFFDAAFPRWPTFGIDLVDTHPDYGAGVYLPNSNVGAVQVKWHHVKERPGTAALADFLATIVLTAKDWGDNAQCRMPGFRDRIAQVSLDPVDGGLNLQMSKEQITRVADYGREAGRIFVDRFYHGHSALNWENHRQVRLRSSLASIEEWLTKAEQGCANPQPGDRAYDQLIRTPAAPSYAWKGDQAGAAEALMAEMRATAQALLRLLTSDRMAVGGPRPSAELRHRPRV